MVTRYPNPDMCPTSQSSGGEVHDNSAAMAPPGSTPVTPMPVGLVETLPLPVDQAPDAVIPNRPRDPGSGQFASSGPAETGPWVTVKGISR